MTRPTHAEETVARLQRAASGGVPLLIPGALEIRAPCPGAPAITNHQTAGVPHGDRARLSARERLEFEREGGGAPSARRGVRRKRNKILATLWRYVFHPSHLFAGWRHVVVQER
jgi:hypothetical protein